MGTKHVNNVMKVEQVGSTIVVKVDRLNLPRNYFLLEDAIEALLTNEIKIIQLEIASAMGGHPSITEICKFTNEKATAASVLERLEKYNLPS